LYEDIVARSQQATEAAVRESQERVNLAVDRAEQAQKKANEATKAIGERWANRINAMRRRAADRDKATEMRFGPEDGPHPNDTAEGDELVSLTETKPSAAPNAPAFGAPEEYAQQPPQQQPQYHQPSPDAARFMQHFDEEEQQPAPTFSPPTRRAAPPRRRPRDDEDDDYSSQSWMQGR
jgi:hypothetical protein